MLTSSSVAARQFLVQPAEVSLYCVCWILPGSQEPCPKSPSFSALSPSLASRSFLARSHSRQWVCLLLYNRLSHPSEAHGDRRLCELCFTECTFLLLGLAGDSTSGSGPSTITLPCDLSSYIWAWLSVYFSGFGAGKADSLASELCHWSLGSPLG